MDQLLIGALDCVFGILFVVGVGAIPFAFINNGLLAGLVAFRLTRRSLAEAPKPRVVPSPTTMSRSVLLNALAFMGCCELYLLTHWFFLA